VNERVKKESKKREKIKERNEIIKKGNKRVRKRIIKE
jgi:hypothetical protein